MENPYPKECLGLWGIFPFPTLSSGLILRSMLLLIIQYTGCIKNKINKKNSFTVITKLHTLSSSSHGSHHQKRGYREKIALGREYE